MIGQYHDRQSLHDECEVDHYLIIQLWMAFVARRQNLDAIFLAIEFIHDHLTKTKVRNIMKIDFKKLYDKDDKIF